MFIDATPMKVTYQPIVDFRGRLERRIDKDFNEAADDNRVDFYGRFRLGFSAKAGKWKAMLVGQIAEDDIWTEPSNFSAERDDMILGWISHPFGGGDVTVGRQRIIKGNQRLIAESNWNNVSNSFDGLRWQSKTLDVFGAGVGVTANPSHKARIGGAAVTSKWGETMYVFKHDDQANVETNIHTFDHLYKYKKGAVSLDVEAAGQIGARNAQEVKAWATTGLLNYKTSAKMSYFGTWNVATGGSSANTYSTFDSLYATGHAISGLSDLQGWRNTQNFGVGVKYKIKKDVEFTGDFFKYNLYSATDGWYSNSGVNRRAGGRFIDPTGAAGKDVGSELAMELRWDASKVWTSWFGLGVFQPGNFVKTMANDNQNHVFGYVQVQYKF